MTPTTDTHTYTVVGMTCDHCVLSVREEVSEVEGVESVDVDLASGRLDVVGETSTTTRSARPSPRPATRSRREHPRPHSPLSRSRSPRFSELRWAPGT